jgi:uncharacterized membrane protein YGL010W
MNPKLKQLFVEYADAHRHPMNRLTHKIAIPLIVFHIIAMLDWVPLFTLAVGDGATVTLAWVAYAVTMLWYLRMHFRLGVVMAILYGACIPLGWVTPVWAVVAIAIGAWLVQLAGHVLWEKNSPAFVRNLVQAVVGPMFFVAIFTGDWPLEEHVDA